MDTLKIASLGEMEFSVFAIILERRAATGLIVVWTISTTARFWLIVHSNLGFHLCSFITDLALYPVAFLTLLSLEFVFKQIVHLFPTLIFFVIIGVEHNFHYVVIGF